MDIKEIAVICSGATGEQSTSHYPAEIEWALIAKFSELDDLTKIIELWNRSSVPGEPTPTFVVTPIKIGSKDCFRVPAGCFFPLRRIESKLKFTNRDGTPADEGLVVGDIYDDRGYIEGQTKASAIFELDQIDEADLADDQLILEFYLNVFATYFVEDEFSTATIMLRNPVSGMQSQPISFKTRSYVKQRLKLSREIPIHEAGETRSVDLLKNLVVDGKLEVILQADHEGIYLGVGAQHLNIRPQAFEYVYESDDELVVTQSVAHMTSLLASHDATISETFPPSDDGIVAIVDVQNPQDHEHLQSLLRLSNPILEPLQLDGDSLTGLHASLGTTEKLDANVSLRFDTSRNAGNFKIDFDNMIENRKASAGQAIEQSVNRLAAFSHLTSMAFDSISFSNSNGPTIEERIKILQQIMERSLANVDVDRRGRNVTILFKAPEIESFDKESVRFALANVEEAMGRDFFNRHRFAASCEMYEHTTSRIPETPQAWMRRAHQIGFNVPPVFDGFQTRYNWTRHGIEILIEGIEKNPKSIELKCLLGNFIGRRIGRSDERDEFRKLFSNDHELHQKIETVVELSDVASPEYDVDSWIVAKCLAEMCLETIEDNKLPQWDLKMSVLLPFSRPAYVQARYAQAMSEAGFWKQSRLAWKEAERQFDEFTDTELPIAALFPSRLDDLIDRTDEIELHEETRLVLEAARESLALDYWTIRCRLEQTDALQQVRKHLFLARVDAHDGDSNKSFKHYQSAIDALVEVENSHPKEFTKVIGDFHRMKLEYQYLAEQLGESDSHSRTHILDIIDEAEAIADRPLFWNAMMKSMSETE
ncbi:hypothetical protein [Thalassoglobus sp.]|uniref:hypothetical protein n=1 Tax=Thalassoglobus sp. TaxID=2795869 RepID=UPI003AA840DD